MDFIDPSMVNETELNYSRELAIERLAEKLSADQTTEFHVLPYFEKQHWIVIVIVLKLNKVYYIDSLSKKENPMDLSFVQKFFDSAHSEYIRIGGNRSDRSKLLQHESISPCP